MRRKGWQGGCATALSLALALGGCGTTATVTRFDDFEIEGHIVDGSSSSITLLDQSQHERQIPRAQIKKISHPGGAAAIIGGILLAYGLYNISVGVSRCQERGIAFCTGVFAPATIGAGMGVWGLVVNNRSREASVGRSVYLNRPVRSDAPGIEPRPDGHERPDPVVAPPPPRRFGPDGEPVIEPVVEPVRPPAP